MKRALIPALCLALLLCVPAIPQDKDSGKEMELRVKALEEQVEKQQAALAEMQTYLGNMRGEAATLAKKLKASEKKGYLYPAPNNDSRRALLYGLQDWAAVAAGGKPTRRTYKVPEELIDK
jgi:septal ring factor EnvC (AmiA/AmiB activator)